jgi:adenosine deaminase
MEETTKDLFKFCQELPKVELHAHLKGSLRESTLLEFYKKKTTP